MPSVETNGVTLEYDSRGDGEPILFIMGLGAQMVSWPDDFLDLFVARGYRAIRFDNRDIGLSSKTSFAPPTKAQVVKSLLSRRKPLDWDGYTLTDMANDAAGLIDELNLGPVHVVGASMGGMIAQELVIGHPDKVRSLCSIMSNTGDRKNGRIAVPMAIKWTRLPEPTLESAVDDGVEVMRLIGGPHFDPVRFREIGELSVSRDFDPAGVARQTGAIAASADRTPRLASVKAPTLVIHGLLDKLVLPSGGVATAKAIPGSRLLAFGDMAHDLPMVRWPEIVDAMVTNFERAPAGGDVDLRSAQTQTPS